MQCPKCRYEPTLTEMQNSPHQCQKCGVFYAKVKSGNAASSSVGDVLNSASPNARTVTFSDWVNSNPKIKVAGALLIGLVIGYFAGREHVKYEIKTALQDSVASIGAAFGLGNKASRPSELPKPSAQVGKPSPIKATLIGKDFNERDYQEFMIIRLGFQNLTGSDVRAFEGVLNFTDLLDNKIFTSNVAVNDPVEVGGSLPWSGEIKYNQFMRDHQVFRNAELSNMKVIFDLKKVLYQDGRLEKF